MLLLQLAIRLIDHISDDINVQNMIRASAERAKMSVLRELGMYFLALEKWFIYKYILNI